MLRLRDRKSTFYCFSPPVMLATFVIELVLAGYTLWRYKPTQLARLIIATLGFLALFQISEYFVCGGAGLSATNWSRIGFAAITMLPPLGVHLLHVLSNRKPGLLVAAAYGTGAGFIAYFLTYDAAFTGHACTGNYVIFQLGTLTSYAYALFYYGWLGAAITLGLRWRKVMREAKRRRAIIALIIGYLVFLVPTGVAVGFQPEALSGIPSIMCGFAVLFAVILVATILPLLGTLRHSPKPVHKKK